LAKKYETAKQQINDGHSLVIARQMWRWTHMHETSSGHTSRRPSLNKNQKHQSY